MAISHNSYCNTEIVADQPQLVSFLAKNPAKKPENACGLPSSSLTPLAEEVQGPPAGEWCPRRQKICILELYSGGPRIQIFSFQKCLLIFENPQKPKYMLQILGKNTEAKFFCRKKAQKLKNLEKSNFFGFWKIWDPPDMSVFGEHKHIMWMNSYLQDPEEFFNLFSQDYYMCGREAIQIS